MRGLLPTRFVHTRNVPAGVVIGIIRTPPERTSPWPVVPKYVAATVGAPGPLAGADEARSHAASAAAAASARQERSRRMGSEGGGRGPATRALDAPGSGRVERRDATSEARARIGARRSVQPDRLV